MKKKVSIYMVLGYIFLILFFITCIFPMLWLLINSFKTQEELFVNTWGFPKVFTISNYVNAIVEGEIGIYFKNSVLISFVAVCCTAVLAVMASYGLTRLKWKLSNSVLNLFLLGMMIPTYGSVIPLYSMFNKMGILNQQIAVIIPHVTFALPMSIFILTGFLVSVPSDLEAAAIIDGCTLPKAFRLIIVPLVKPGIVTIAVIAFINSWNDLLFSQIFLIDRDKMPLPVGLMEYKGIYSTNYVGMIAAIVITVIPVIIVYCILHQKIIDGMITGAVKG